MMMVNEDRISTVIMGPGAFPPRLYSTSALLLIYLPIYLSTSLFIYLSIYLPVTEGKNIPIMMVNEDRISTVIIGPGAFPPRLYSTSALLLDTAAPTSW